MVVPFNKNVCYVLTCGATPPSRTWEEDRPWARKVRACSVKLLQAETTPTESERRAHVPSIVMSRMVVLVTACSLRATEVANGVMEVPTQRSVRP